MQFEQSPENLTPDIPRRTFVRLSFASIGLSAATSLLVGCQASAPAPQQTAKPAQQTGPSAGPTVQQSVPATAPVVSIRLGHQQPTTDVLHTQADKFKEAIEKRSTGKIQVQIFPQSQLGDAKASIEGMRLGTLDMFVAAPAPLVGLEPMIGVFDIPFLLRDDGHVAKVLDGPFADDLNGRLQSKGIRILAFGSQGWRHIINRIRPVKTPEDLKGLKIRTLESKIQVAAFKALGANPTPMAFPEVYTALQQGTIDGLDMPVGTTFTNRFHEVAKHISLTSHLYGSAAFMMSNIVWERIPKDLQPAVLDAAKDARAFGRELIQKTDNDYLAKLKEAGMQVAPDVDKGPWLKAMEPVFQDLAKEFAPGLVTTIRDTK